MEPTQASRQRPSPPESTQQHPAQPPLHTHLPPSASFPLRTASSTPMSSPGLFSPSVSRHNLFQQTSISESNSPGPESTPYLHPLQLHRVRETHKALIDSDINTGRKLINQYEVIEEIGRGMHGKVKLARNLETGDNVAIKIIPRFSKKRRLGKVTAKSPQDKTKKEIAILKKIRHENVVALLEVIDDPELKKIYMVLEHAELGEIIWRKKGLAHICQYERRRVEREMRGEPPTLEEERYSQLLERRQALKDMKRVRMAQNYAGPSDYWSLEHGVSDEPSSYGAQSRIASKDDFALSEGTPSSHAGSRQPSRGPSRSQSVTSVCHAPSELDVEVDWNDDMETPGPLRSNPNSAAALDGTMYGGYVDENRFRGRAPSMADSIISHMSSVDFFSQAYDTFAEDFSFVPCFTLDQARSTFRDTILGLEYLHYQGVVHRDIKPANLLWSKDHEVKISDFGVSYFGRPNRDGEADETVSESEARDFDDDLELAKTVGTPAFFAPELCYTDVGREPPKISEQIDIWSLGVTLYCLVYARIPFLAEDEFQMFRKIATDEVHIPTRRLKPVDPSTSPDIPSLYKRHNPHPYRDDNDLEYEDVDDDLRDLFRQMLTKNPDHRIRLRDIKRHPWIIRGVTNPIGWLDDTDPARPSSGRKIEVNDRDMSDAVIPLTFFEKASSTIRKAIGKVIHPLVERSDSRSRRRAASSVTSSAGDSMLNAPPSTYTRAERRKSLHPDDYFANAMDHGSSADTSVQSPESMVYDPMATMLAPAGTPDETPRDTRPQQQPHSRSFTKQTPSTSLYASPVVGAQTMPTTPSGEHRYNAIFELGMDTRKARNIEAAEDDSSRSRSVDRGLFGVTDKRASAQVSVNTVNAPGNLEPPRHPRPMRSVDLGRSYRIGVAKPLSTYIQSGSGSADQSESDFTPSMRQQVAAIVRPRTAPRTENPLLPQNFQDSNSKTFAEAQGVLSSQPEKADVQEDSGIKPIDPINIPCPPSPAVEEWPQMPTKPCRGGTMTTVQSSSTESMDALGTPLTCPSEVTSPASSHVHRKNVSERMLAFQSDPSLPALLSGASSVSADLEAELLNRPGIVSTKPSLLETTDSLTPPALMKEATDGFPGYDVFDHRARMDSGSIALHIGADKARTPELRTTPARPASDNGDMDADDDDDGSDDGILLMAKSKKRRSSPAMAMTAAPLFPPFEVRRRDTNISTTSVETARQDPIRRDEEPQWYATP